MSLWARKGNYKAVDMKAGAGKAPREEKRKGKTIRSAEMRAPPPKTEGFAWVAYCFIRSAAWGLNKYLGNKQQAGGRRGQPAV